MNKRGFELAISTLVVIVLAVVLLVVLILFFTGGFEKLTNFFKNIMISDIAAVKKACELACNTKNDYDFCCLQRDVKINGEKQVVNCSDNRIKVSCEINCEEVC